METEQAPCEFQSERAMKIVAVFFVGVKLTKVHFILRSDTRKSVAFIRSVDCFQTQMWFQRTEIKAP